MQDVDTKCRRLVGCSAHAAEWRLQETTCEAELGKDNGNHLYQQMIFFPL